MKRKVDNDFSISSSATKIRRLDGDLLPIEEEVMEASLEPSPIIPESPSENQERALVLFKPVNQSPSSFSLAVDSDIFSAINNTRPWSRHSIEEEAIRNDRLALVPWAPSQFQSPPSAQDSSFEQVGGGEESMDMEEEQDYSGPFIQTTNELTAGAEGLQPWQQQHCFMPHFLHNTSSTPISWTR